MEPAETLPVIGLQGRTGDHGETERGGSTTCTRSSWMSRAGSAPSGRLSSSRGLRRRSTTTCGTGTLCSRPVRSTSPPSRRRTASTWRCSSLTHRSALSPTQLRMRRRSSPARSSSCMTTCPPFLKKAVPYTKGNVRELHFANGSGIRVATSLRGGTRWIFLHISEFAKICVPRGGRKRRRSLAGALNGVPQYGTVIIVESTAEGPDGKFAEMY